MEAQKTCTAFSESKRVASGEIHDVATKVKEFLKKNPKSSVLVFDDTTSQQVELDLRGTTDAVAKRYEPAVEEEKKPGPGRPKLGVVPKEVTLLPQHWDWLAIQPGGASVTLRRLVDEARKKSSARDQLRQAQDATYKFMTAMAGDFPDYEEALRALFAKDAEKFKKLVGPWAKDVREHVLRLADSAF